MQGTRFHAERPRVSHSQLPYDERGHSLGIRLASGRSPRIEHCHPLLFQTGSRKKQIQVVLRVKQCGLVFDKRVIEVATRSIYPYGYERIGNELDLLLDLEKT